MRAIELKIVGERERGGEGGRERERERDGEKGRATNKNFVLDACDRIEDCR